MHWEHGPQVLDDLSAQLASPLRRWVLPNGGLHKCNLALEGHWLVRLSHLSHDGLDEGELSSPDGASHHNCEMLRAHRK